MSGPFQGDFRRKDGKPLNPMTMEEFDRLDFREMEVYDGEKWIDGARLYDDIALSIDQPKQGIT